MNALQIEPIDAQSFADFGRVIEFTKDAVDTRFEIIVKEEAEPWRIAVLCVTIRETTRLENHPTSMESFEPAGGFGVLLVAENENPSCVRAFALDKPICLNKGVWHEVLTLSAESHYRITENKVVTTEFCNFETPIKIAVTLDN